MNQKKDIYTYQIGDSLYLNITNKCTNDCVFCVRRNDDVYEDYELWLKKEPTPQEVIDEIGDPTRYKEIVFCGFGESTMRLDAIKEIARAIKAKGGKVRINTNGLANLYYKRNIAPELEGLVDTVSISLNASNAKDYDKICKSRFGEAAFEGLKEFAKDCKPYIPKVILSVVDSIGPEEIEKCRKIAEELGVTLRVREYIS